MSHQVTIQPSGHQFTVKPGETLLSAALNAGFSLPYGCRNGACGACKGKILAGAVDYGVFQEGALSQEDKAQGLALFCCAKAETDLVIEVKEVGAARDIPIRTLPCRIEKMEKLAEDVMALWLKLPSNERLQFLPGQYIDFLLKDGKRRSFSLANSPEEDALLELHIRHVPGGQFTDHVFGAMKEKDILRIEGPYGSFYLREDSPKPMVLLASGTGFAPIKALVEHMQFKRITRPATLYWGGRRPEDLYLNAWVRAQVTAMPNLSYVPVVSDATPADAWTGRTGFVHRAVLQDFPDLSGHQVYACGAPIVVDSARKDYTSLGGLPEDDFFADSFTSEADKHP